MGLFTEDITENFLKDLDNKALEELSKSNKLSEFKPADIQQI
jgi:hypothetical protein